MSGIVEFYPWALNFSLSRIIDADTVAGVALVQATCDLPVLSLVADVVLPWPVTVRLEGVNAPEMKTAEGKVAKQFTEAWFTERDDEPLYLATNGKRDNFGRVLGDIRMSPSHLTGLAWDLLRTNHAVIYTASASGSW
jgi:hypothetical protein